MEIIPQILINGVITASLYGLVALGFNLMYSTGKFLNLAYGSVLMLSGYAVFALTHSIGLPTSVSIIISLCLCGLFGFVTYRTVYSRLAARKASSKVFLIASLGIYTVVQAILVLVFTSQYRTLGNPVQTIFSFGNIIITSIQLLTMISFLVLVVAVFLILKYTRQGKAIRAVADDAEMSAIMGIDTQRIISLAFIGGSVIGGVAGLMAAYDTGLEPVMAFTVMARGIIAAIIGGAGNVWGGVIGALIIGLVENLVLWQLSGEWKDVVAFSILILFLIFRPQGIFKS